MQIPRSMKTEIDAAELENVYDKANNRLIWWNTNTPFWIRLLFLFSGQHLFVINNASLLKHKMK